MPKDKINLIFEHDKADTEQQEQQHSDGSGPDDWDPSDLVSLASSARLRGGTLEGIPLGELLGLLGAADSGKVLRGHTRVNDGSKKASPLFVQVRDVGTKDQPPLNSAQQTYHIVKTTVFVEVERRDNNSEKKGTRPRFTRRKNSKAQDAPPNREKKPKKKAHSDLKKDKPKKAKKSRLKRTTSWVESKHLRRDNPEHIGSQSAKVLRKHLSVVDVRKLNTISRADPITTSKVKTKKDKKPAKGDKKKLKSSPGDTAREKEGASSHTLGALLLNMTAHEYRPAYFTKSEHTGEWEGTSWGQLRLAVLDVARALHLIGVQKGSRVILLNNYATPRSTMVFLASVCIGAVPIGVSPEFADPHTLIDSVKAKYILVDGISQWKSITDCDTLDLKAVILANGMPVKERWILTWKELLLMGSTSDEQLTSQVNNVHSDDIATICFTPGTTGAPKGVMLTHESLVWTGKTLAHHLGVSSHDSAVVFSSLSHITAILTNVVLPLSSYSNIYYSSSMSSFGKEMQSVQPTMLFAPPQIWTKMFDSVKTTLKNTVPAEIPLANLEVLWRMLGCGRLRVAVSGYGHLPVEVIRYFGSLGLSIRVLYGQSETSGVTGLCSLEDGSKASTKLSFAPLPGVRTVTSEGALKVSGPNVFAGYILDQPKRSEQDKWFSTGDLVEPEEDKFALHGRAEQVIALTNRTKVNLFPLENMLRAHPIIQEVVCYGESLPYLTAIVTLNPSILGSMAAERSVRVKSLFKGPCLKEITRIVQKHVHRCNETLPESHPRVKRFTIIPRQFSSKRGEVTHTMQPRRAAIFASCKKQFERMYEVTFSDTEEAESHSSRDTSESGDTETKTKRKKARSKNAPARGKREKKNKRKTKDTLNAQV